MTLAPDPIVVGALANESSFRHTHQAPPAMAPFSGPVFDADWSHGECQVVMLDGSEWF